MSEKKPQTLANHAKLVPGYHFVLLGLLVLNLGWRIWQLIKLQNVAAAFGLVVAISLIMLLLYSRAFILKVQDRVIRLEERLRLARLLPADLQTHIDTLTVDQLVALRFASDGELPELVRDVVTSGITTRKEIKQRIKTWRPDYHRA